MAITTIEAAGARSCIARSNCSIPPAVRHSLISGALVASLLASADSRLLVSGGVCRLPASNPPLFFLPCTFIRLEDDRLTLVDSLRAPASYLAHRLAAPYRA